MPATEIAREHLGKPLPNAALLGAVAALTGRLALDSITAAIAQRFAGAMGEANAAAARHAHSAVLQALREPAHA